MFPPALLLDRDLGRAKEKALTEAEIVTVCGSMRHYNQMLALANELTLDGKIVLLPFVLKIDDPGMDEALQKLHRAKIGLSRAIYVVGEPGTSTSEEISHAESLGIEVRLALAAGRAEEPVTFEDSEADPFSWSFGGKPDSRTVAERSGRDGATWESCTKEET